MSNAQQAVDLFTNALAGLSKELRERIALELKPIIDLRGKYLKQTVTQWAWDYNLVGLYWWAGFWRTTIITYPN